jgi:hypothetical protein
LAFTASSPQEKNSAASEDRAALDKVSRLHEEGSKVIAALQTEVQRLTEENVQLVGHTNLKQKIQMHAKVKDENQKQKVQPVFAHPAVSADVSAAGGPC